MIEGLEEIGFSEGQASVYNATLELGISTINKIQEKTGIERRNIYDILNKLIGRGLISYTVESGKRTYQCTHPNKLKEEIMTRKEALGKLTYQLPKVEDLFNSTRPDIRAEVFRGNEALKALLEEMLEYECSHWIGGNSSIEQTNLRYWFKHWMARRVERQHTMYDLVDHGTYLESLPPDNVEKHKEQLYKYHPLPENLSSPMVIVIFGDRVAQILWAEQSFAFVLDSREIKESFMQYFKYFWKDP